VQKRMPQIQIIGNQKPPRMKSFEVSLEDGTLLHSRLVTGSFPDVDKLIDELERRIDLNWSGAEEVQEEEEEKGGRRGRETMRRTGQEGIQVSIVSPSSRSLNAAADADPPTHSSNPGPPSGSNRAMPAHHQHPAASSASQSSPHRRPGLPRRSSSSLMGSSRGLSSEGSRWMRRAKLFAAAFIAMGAAAAAAIAIWKAHERSGGNSSGSGRASSGLNAQTSL